jgi:hypothetical protein
MFNSASTLQNSCHTTALSATRLSLALLHCASAVAVHRGHFWCRNLTPAQMTVAIVLPAFQAAVEKQASGHDKNCIDHLTLRYSRLYRNGLSCGSLDFTSSNFSLIYKRVML